VLYDEGGIKIVRKELITDETAFGPELWLYIENNTDADVTVQCRDVSVNGYMIEPTFSADVMAGRRRNGALFFFTSDMEENDIEKITEIELSFHIFDYETWDTIVDTNKITMTFPG